MPDKKQETSKTPRVEQKPYKPPIAGATEPMEQAIRTMLTPPTPAEPPDFPPAVEPKPHEAEHWAEGSLPPEWDKLRDEARQIAIDAANRAYERGMDEADAITTGVIAAKEWAKARNVNVRE